MRELTRKQNAVLWYYERHTVLYGKPPGSRVLAKVFRISRHSAEVHRKYIRAKGFEI